MRAAKVLGHVVDVLRREAHARALGPARDLLKARLADFRTARTHVLVERNLERGIHSIVLHFEDAAAIEAGLSNLGDYYATGLRSLGLVWSRPTLYAEGVPFKFPHSPDTGPGLTDTGRALVQACNQLGILIDLSHLNEKGFWDVARITDAPLVATHSNAWNLCQLPRNLIDKPAALSFAEAGALPLAGLTVSQAQTELAKLGLTLKIVS